MPTNTIIMMSSDKTKKAELKSTDKNWRIVNRTVNSLCSLVSVITIKGRPGDMKILLHFAASKEYGDQHISLEILELHFIVSAF